MAANVEISEWIDQQSISRVQILVLCLSALSAMLEGLDAQIIGYLAPAIIRDWHIPPQSFTPVFVSGLIGLLVGCLFLAPLADVVGRKRVLIGSMAAFGVFTLISAAVTSLQTLSLLRFLTDVGLGAGLANAIALTSEFFPTRKRAGMTVIMFCGFPLGAALGGFLAGALIPTQGWPVVFVWGGVLPLVAAVVLALALPESIRHLAVRRAEPERLISILKRINPQASFPSGTVFSIKEEHRSGLTVRHLFESGRAAGTVLLWIIFFMSLLDIFLLTSWLPTVLHGAGFTISVAVVMTALLQGSGVIASLVIGPILTRRSCLAVLFPLYLIAGIGIAGIGLAGTTTWLIVLATCASGVGIVAGQNTANALASIYYPTYIRATGVGWALGIGRFGAIVGPAVGGLMLATHWSRLAIFTAGAVPAFVAALAVLTLARIERAKSAAAVAAAAAASL